MNFWGPHISILIKLISMQTLTFVKKRLLTTKLKPLPIKERIRFFYTLDAKN